MAQDSLMGERYLLVARFTKRQLETFPAKGWVVVEVFNDETSGRERFHEIRLPLERLKLGAVLVRAMTTAGFERISYEKTVISKDADFWDLKHAELMRATQSQQDSWAATIDSILAEVAAEHEASAVAATQAKVSKAQARAGQHQRHAAMAAGFVAVLAIAGVVAFARQGDAPAASMVARGRDDSMTVIIADPTDARMLTEYALKPDGTRTVVRRLTREQVAAGAGSADAEVPASSPTRPAKKSLVEALNGFFAFRE